jgi:predicted transporter
MSAKMAMTLRNRMLDTLRRSRFLEFVMFAGLLRARPWRYGRRALGTNDALAVSLPCNRDYFFSRATE